MPRYGGDWGRSSAKSAALARVGPEAEIHGRGAFRSEKPPGWSFGTPTHGGRCDCCRGELVDGGMRTHINPAMVHSCADHPADVRRHVSCALARWLAGFSRPPAL